jgi:hypothetical protein
MVGGTFVGVLIGDIVLARSAAGNHRLTRPVVRLGRSRRVKFGIDSTRRRRLVATNRRWLSRRC